MAGEIDWQARAERAEAACAEMRQLLLESPNPWPKSQSREWITRRIHALSTSCGKDWVPFASLDAARKENAKLYERVEKAEKACAEMRKLLVGAIPSMKCTPFLSQAEKWMQEKTHALSSDCGSGYVRREELDAAKTDNARLRKALDKVRGFGRSDMGHQQLCDYVTEVAEEALAGKEAE